MPILVASAVIMSTAVGAFAQQVSGLGFALIAAPSLALAVGPRDGVALTNVLAMVVAMAVFAPSARNVDAAKAVVLIPAGLIGVVPGTIVFHVLPAGCPPPQPPGWPPASPPRLAVQAAPRSPSTPSPPGGPSGSSPPPARSATRSRPRPRSRSKAARASPSHGSAARSPQP